jgi:hypothetical protein
MDLRGVIVADVKCTEISLTVKDIVGFEVFTAVTMKNGVFWDVMPCGSCKNRRYFFTVCVGC